MGSSANCSASTIVRAVFPSFFLLSGGHVASTAAFGAFTYAFVPETKGRSLREVTASFDSLSTSPLQ